MQDFSKREGEKKREGKKRAEAIKKALERRLLYHQVCTDLPNSRDTPQNLANILYVTHPPLTLQKPTYCT